MTHANEVIYEEREGRTGYWLMRKELELAEQEEIISQKIPPQRGGSRIGQMNKTELWYYDHVLKPRLLAGTYQYVGFEKIAFTLAHSRSRSKKRMITYRPDFFLVLTGHFEFHEVKARRGDWTSARDDAMVKLRMAVELYPWFVWKLIEVEREKVYEYDM